MSRPANPRVLPAARRWLDVGGVHLEGVTWDAAAGRVRFVDIPRGLLFDVAPDGPGTARAVQVEAPVTAVHPTTDPGRLLVADGDGIALVTLPPSGGPPSGPPGAPVAAPAVERLADPLAGRPGIRMNDGGVSPEGRYLAGSMAYDTTPGAACLYRLDGDGSLHTVLTGVTISNGIDWSPDGTLCYYVDTPTRRIDVLDHDPATGALSGRRPLADVSALPGEPDGLTVDAEGHVWVAFWGGSQVCRFTPEGGLDAVVPLPVSQVTSCAFGGAGLDRLYVTTSTEGLSPERLAARPGAGALFVADPGGATGRPPTPYPLMAPPPSP